MSICRLLRDHPRLRFLLRILTIEVGHEFPQGERQRDALGALELLVEEDNGKDLQHRQEDHDHCQRGDADDQAHDPSASLGIAWKSPMTAMPSKHTIVPAAPITARSGSRTSTWRP